MKRTIDALAYDRNILAGMLRQQGLSAELTDVTFEATDPMLRFSNPNSLMGGRTRSFDIWARGKTAVR